MLFFLIPSYVMHTAVFFITDIIQAVLRLIKTEAVPSSLLEDVTSAMSAGKGALLTCWSQKGPGGAVSARCAVASLDKPVLTREFMVHPCLGFQRRQQQV